MKNYFSPLLLLTLLSFVVIGELLFMYYRVSRNEFVPAQIAGVAKSLLQAASQNENPKLLFVGDVMLGRRVEGLMQSEGADYPFEHISGLLGEYKNVVANLEGPVVNAHFKTPELTMRFSLAPYVPTLLKKYNITTVSLANNHTYDQGIPGYFETAKLLDEVGIDHAGNPFSTDEGYVLKKTIDGKQFIFLSFNTTDNHFGYASAGALAQKVKSENPGSYLVALIHGGDEYSLTANAYQIAFAHTLADQGVDLIIGHHPHVVEQIELYKGTPIFYSLGNFIFDQYFSKDVEQGLAVGLEFKDGHAVFTLIPIQSARSQPAYMAAPARDQFLAELAARSTETLQAEIKSGGFIITTPLNTETALKQPN